MTPALQELKDNLDLLMRHWSPSRYSSDFKCVFCYERPKTNIDEIVHTDNCLGTRLEKELADTELLDLMKQTHMLLDKMGPMQREAFLNSVRYLTANV